MKDIFVYSRPAIEASSGATEPHVIVSINCPGEEPPKIRSNGALLGRVNLFFWDLDQVPEGGKVRRHGSDTTFYGITEETLCQPSDAKAIVDLVLAHPEAKEILVHCLAGKSRSAAVAAALHKVLNGSDEVIFKNLRYRPNMRVYRMVLEEWHSRHPQE